MQATIYRTNFKKNQIWEEEKVTAGGIDFAHQLSISSAKGDVVFQGFGGAFTESTGYNLLKLSEEKQQEFLESYFGEDGLRYTRGRTHMGSCDFSLGHYEAASSKEELDAGVFRTDRDEKYIIPVIKAAEKVAGQGIGLLLSPWSPLAFMKTNGDRNHGGKLLEESKADWAKVIAEYVAYYRSQGLNVTHVSIQNEPAAVQTWDSCEYTGEEEGSFAANYLAPALKEKGLSDVKILAWDHNKEVAVTRAQETFGVPGAKEVVDGIALHWYSGDHFGSIDGLRYLYPEKEVWFTEGCVEYSRFEDSNALHKAEMYAHDIIGNLNAGINGSLDWNLLLDAQGGPNHVGNFCEAPIMLTEDETDFLKKSEYYYIGQISRYIKPGAVKRFSSIYDSTLESVVYENTDGTLACVLLNRTEEDKTVCITLDAVHGYDFVVESGSMATFVI